MPFVLIKNERIFKSSHSLVLASKVENVATEQGAHRAHHDDRHSHVAGEHLAILTKLK